MKATLKYIVFGILILFFYQSNGQEDQSSKIEIFKNFSKSDFEKIEKDYKYSFETIKNLFGIVLLNNFPQIENKFQVQLQVKSDSIEFATVTHEGRYYEVTNNSLYLYNQIFIDYFYQGQTIFIQYRKVIESKEVESLYSDKSKTEYIKFEDNYANSKKIDKSSGQIMEGQYRILEQSKADTIITLNQLTYGEQASIIRTKLEKTGKWKVFDKEGNLIKIE